MSAYEISWPRLRAMVTAPLAMAAGVYMSVRPLISDLSILIPLGMSVLAGMALTALAGWRHRRIFWAWPLCYAAGGILLIWLVIPDGALLAHLSPSLLMALAGGTLPMAAGAALPALWWWLQPRQERAVRLWAVAMGAVSVLVGWMAWFASPVLFGSGVPWGATVPEVSAAVFFVIGVGLGMLAGRSLWRLHWVWPALVGCGLMIYALMYAKRFLPDGLVIILAMCVPVWMGTAITAQWMRWRESRRLLRGH